jgi:hypothetical protein
LLVRAVRNGRLSPVPLLSLVEPVELTKPHQCPWLDVTREFARVFPMKNFGGFLAGEAFNHWIE